MLKDCISSIADPLLFICNLSFEKGIFPDRVKISKVIPVFKKGSKTIMSNYRPISITNPVGKILEKLMHSRMVKYLEKFNLIYDYQFGFRKNHSTTIAVIDVVNMIQNYLHEGKYVMGIFMDLQKAFDTVNINILLAKLEHYGFRGNALRWFKSYLEGRSQFTEVNKVLSSTKMLNCGVPQGTVLGPLLFLLYINDISNSVVNSNIKLCADDSNLFVTANNLSDLFQIANDELLNLSHWISANKLHINYDKTNFMIFDPFHKIKNKPLHYQHHKLSFSNHIIERVHCVRYLGLLIDDQLNWTDHINYLIGRVSSVMGILYRYKNVLPWNCKKNIYFALVHSIIIYGIEVYANTCKKYLKPLITKCNSLLRILQDKPRRTHVYDLYSTYNTLPIEQLFELYTLKFVHRCLYDCNNMPQLISEWFKRGSNTHTHNTRNKNNFSIQSKHNPKSILFYGPLMWSKLSAALQNNPSLKSFMKQHKIFLLNSIA